jgi:preprotein translocase subunit SecE
MRLTRNEMAKANDKVGGKAPRTKGKAMTPVGAGASGGGVTTSEPDAPPRPRIGPFKFAQQVRQEVMKVTWPSRQETVVTTIMVFIMVILAATFFALVDAGLGTLRDYLLSLLG